MYVPQEDRDDLGEVHVGFSPREGIQTVQHVKELPVQRPSSVDMHNRFENIK